MLSAKEKKELLEFMPNFEELNINAHKAKLDRIEYEHTKGNKHATVRAWSTSYYSILKEINTLIDKGYKIDSLLSNKATQHGSFTVIAHLPDDEVKVSLDCMLEGEKRSFKDKIKELKEQWIEQNLQPLINEKEAELEAKAEQDKEAHKTALFSKLLSD